MNYVFSIVICCLLVWLLWRWLLSLALWIISRLSPNISLRLADDDVIVEWALVTTRMDAIVSLHITLPTIGLSNGGFGIVLPRISAEVDLHQLRRRSAETSPPADGSTKKIGSASNYFWFFKNWLPLRWVSLLDVTAVVRFSNPPKVKTLADATGGFPWEARIGVEGLRVGMAGNGFFFTLKKLHAGCHILDISSGEPVMVGESVEWMRVEDCEVTSRGKGEVEVVVAAIRAKMSIEMFYSILPTIAPLIELRDTSAPPEHTDVLSPPPVLAIAAAKCVCKELSVQFLSATVGSAKLRIPNVSVLLSPESMSGRADGCVIIRHSPDHGEAEIVRLPPFSLTGSDSFSVLDFFIPHAVISVSPDGLVFWIRALIMCGSKGSFTKRPWRVAARNARVQAFYDHIISSTPLPDFLPNYLPKIVPVRIRIHFTSSIEFLLPEVSSSADPGVGESILTEDALLDCNLPAREIAFSVNGIEAFGQSRRRCVSVKKFSGHVAQFSGVCLHDSGELLNQTGKAGHEVACEFASPGTLGALPVALAFSDVSVECAQDLILLVGRQLMEATASLRRWTVDAGFALVPVYRPVTVRLSKVRFAPRELAPAVLDVNRFEIAVGPTKDCLSFAFVGVKAWVPSTVTTPPILSVQDPAIVEIRVKRKSPVIAIVQSDWSLLPGSWRELRVELPAVTGAVAPGLHATTRFINTIMATVGSVTAGAVPVKRGPVKNISIKSQGVSVGIIRSARRFTSPVTLEDAPESSGIEVLGTVSLGPMVADMYNIADCAKILIESISIGLTGVAKVSLGEISFSSMNGEAFTCCVSRQSPVDVNVTANAMAIFGAYSAVKDCFIKAWSLDHAGLGLNRFVTHIVETVEVEPVAGHIADKPTAEDTKGKVGRDVSVDTSPSGKTSVVNGKFVFSFPSGINVVWSVPHAPARCIIRVPPDRLHGEAVVHGFAFLGSNVLRRLPDLTDPVLIQWLRYPWTVSAGPTDDASSSGDSSPKSPSVAQEKQSWDLHSIMTMRISDYLASAGRDGRWEYTSARGLVDTPVYGQLLLAVQDVEVRVGSPGQETRLLGIDGLEIRSHCHNLPSSGKAAGVVGTVGRPKIKVSYWTSWVQNPERKGLILDFVPEVHVGIFLALLGSPADADQTTGSAANAATVGAKTFGGESASELPVDQMAARLSPPPPLSPAAGGVSLLEQWMDQVDLGFRVTISGIAGRAAGWNFTASRIALFKEEDRGKGLIVAEIRDAQVSMETTSTASSSANASSGMSTMSLQGISGCDHHRVCLSVPTEASFQNNNAARDVFPFLSVKQMIVHIGLPTLTKSSTPPPPLSSRPTSPTSPSSSSAESPVVFCNIQGGRLWWSPSLNRGMRLSLSRTDSLVATLGRWKTRFTSELNARLGKSGKKKKTLESIMKLLEMFIPSGGGVKLILRCADIQLSFHNVLAVADDAASGAGGVSSGAVNGSSADIPVHFLPFAAPPPMDGSTPPLPTFSRTQTPVGGPRHSSACSCCTLLDSGKSPAPVTLKSDPFQLEIPKLLTWWVRAGHLKNCALPPLPLMSFAPPSNSRKERLVGAVRYDKWVNLAATATSPPAAGEVSGKPKPRGSQMLLNSTEAVFEIALQRTKSAALGAGSLKVSFAATFGTIQGSVAPTALRGLIWLGQSGQTVLRQILQIQKVSLVVSAELFPLRSACVRLYIPKVLLSTDDDAFHILVDVFRNCLLYRGALIDPTSSTSSAAGPTSPAPSVAQLRPNGGSTSVSHSKREALIEGLLTALAVADATLAPSTDFLSFEYLVDSIALNLTHRQKCFVQLQLSGIVGKHTYALGHPHRPMHLSFQLGDVRVDSTDGLKPVLQSGAAASGGSTHGAVLTIRGNDRYLTLNNREWQVYDSLFLSTSPIVVDVNQELIEELYSFVFPGNSGQPEPGGGGSVGASASMSTASQVGYGGGGSVGGGEFGTEHTEVVGNKLLTGRIKSRASIRTAGPANPSAMDVVSVHSSPHGFADPRSTPSHSGQLIFFKFVRIGNIDSIITFKGKQFSLNHMSLTLKYYLKRRRLASWKEFLDEWGAKVGKQAFGSFVKHGFTRKRGIQDIIVNKFTSSVGSNSDMEKLLFGKYAHQ